MKRVTVTLPDEVYYGLQTEAGKAHMETKDYIREILIEEADVQIEYDKEIGYKLRDFVLGWDWPNKQLKEGSAQAKNVIGVVRYMDQGLDFPNAVKRRADDAREEDPDRGPDYEKTVRAGCTKRGQGVTSSVDEFKSEVEKLLTGFRGGN